MAEEKKIATGYIGNALRSSAADHTTTFADEIFDTGRQKYQNEVTADLEATDEEIKADLEAEKAAIMGTDRIADKAVTATKLADGVIVQDIGLGEQSVMSQKAVSGKLSDLYSKTDSIQNEVIEEDAESMQFLSDDGKEVIHEITNDKANFHNLKKDGIDVATQEDISVKADISMFNELKQKTDSIQNEVIEEDAESMQFLSNDGKEVIHEITNDKANFHNLKKDGIDVATFNDIEGGVEFNIIKCSPKEFILPYYNGLRMNKEVESTKITLDDGFSHSSHDSSIIIKEGIAYLTWMSNTSITGGDNAGTDTCIIVLCKYSLSNPADATYKIVSQKDSTYDGITISNGSGSPILVEDKEDVNILHIIWSSGVSDGYYCILTCDYNISADTLTNYRKVNAIKDSNSGILNNEWLNVNYNANLNVKKYANGQSNCVVGYYQGYYYIGYVFGYLNGKSIIFKTNDFTNWNYVSDSDMWNLNFIPVFETAVYVDTDGYIYAAVRPSYPQKHVGTGILIASKSNGALIKLDNNGKLIDKAYFQTCSTKPAFYEYKNKLYLISSPYSRNNICILEVNKYELISSFFVLEGEPNLNYQCPYIVGSELYISFTRNKKINVSKITAEFDNDTAKSILYTVFNL